MDQITDTILMVRPAHFGFNAETAENNAFQSNDTDLSQAEISRLAIGEFDAMVDQLRSHGIEVIVAQDSDEPLKTDSVFPNNWFSTHQDGSLYLFPMYSANRRLERDPAIVQSLVDLYGFEVKDKLLISESKGIFLEGTGSMIIDRPNKIIYACYSERTNAQLLEEFAAELGYEAIGFHANDDNGVPFYHTNVIMTLGEDLVIICTESIENKNERDRLLISLKSSAKTVIQISQEQVIQFAGNMLELRSKKGDKFIIMSTQAYNSLDNNQLDIINKYNTIIHIPLFTIEKFGGGSARCMIAEIFRS